MREKAKMTSLRKKRSQPSASRSTKNGRKRHNLF